MQMRKKSAENIILRYLCNEKDYSDYDLVLPNTHVSLIWTKTEITRKLPFYRHVHQNNGINSFHVCM